MSQLTILAFFRAKPGRTQALDTALSALVDPPRAEPECLNYDQSLDDADVWIVHDNWRSAAGLEAHMRSPHLQPILNAMPDLVAGDHRSSSLRHDLNAKHTRHRRQGIPPTRSDSGSGVGRAGAGDPTYRTKHRQLPPGYQCGAGVAQVGRRYAWKDRVTVDPEVGHQEARLPWI